MDANQIDQFLALNSENLPEEKINELRELLADADDNKANLLNAISLKGKTMMLIISIFLGSYGVDRFRHDQAVQLQEDHGGSRIIPFRILSVPKLNHKDYLQRATARCL